jgi:tRNA-splicing endonuclease subunit Sen2
MLSEPLVILAWMSYTFRVRGPDTYTRFAMVLIPVYEDPDDAVSSPFALSNVEPFTWQWLSTINRVNSQVQKVCPRSCFLWLLGDGANFMYKTLILSHVTIPALSRLSVADLSSPACFQRYVIREIIVRRFVPARMRD